MLTNRDKEVLEFISKNPCRSDTIIRLFYPSYRVGTKRLQVMTDAKYLKRYRESPNCKYFCYVGSKPKQLEHMDMAVKTILWVKSKGYTVLSFKREIKLDGARPDAIIGIEKNGQYGILMVEIERFNNTLKKKIELYERILEEGKYFNTFKILYVCNKEITSDKVDVINVKPKEIEKI